MSYSQIQKLEKIVDNTRKFHPRNLVYILLFFYCLHLTPTLYILSSFISNLIGEKSVGFFYVAASVASIIVFILIKQFLQIKGNYKTFIISITISFINALVSSLSLIVDVNPFWITVFIISNMMTFIAHAIGFLSIDIFIEHYTKNVNTGGIRGTFLTFGNFAYILGPLFAGFLIGESNLIGRAFLLSAILLIPVFFLAHIFFRKFYDSEYSHSEFLKTAFKIYHHPDLSKISLSNFILQFFYSWMIIYVPIFLYQHIGFSIGETTALISICLIPFLLLQYPLGYIADKFLGEKEISIIGFIIASFATILMAFISVKTFWIWAIILFFTRVGAATIEIMNEAYLFKKINDGDADVISFFRMIRSVSYIVSAIIASIIIWFFSMKIIFVVLAVVLAYGAGLMLGINDTK